jgi:serine/threonine-protein kinase
VEGGDGSEGVERARERVGHVLKGKWRLERLIAVGGMAAVYEAIHRNGKRVAVKILHAELAVDRNTRARFLREGYAANKVDHPGTVSILDDDVAEDGTVFLVMDLLDGETLEERRKRQGDSVHAAEVLAIGYQLLDILAAAHDKGIVHRDIKPDNVMITRDGVVKLLDFGIARIRGPSPGLTSALSSIGTPAFMPPEQARGRWDSVDARSDIWAVGATMFTLLTGRTVHGGGTSNEHLLAATTSPAPPLATLLPGLSPLLAEIVDRTLAFDKAARWADAREMQEAIRACYAALQHEPELTLEMTTQVLRRSPGEDAVTAVLRTNPEPDGVTTVLHAVPTRTLEPSVSATVHPAVPSGATTGPGRVMLSPRGRIIAAAVGLLLAGSVVALVVPRGAERPAVDRPTNAPGAPSSPGDERSPVGSSSIPGPLPVAATAAFSATASASAPPVAPPASAPAAPRVPAAPLRSPRRPESTSPETPATAATIPPNLWNQRK